MTLLGGFSMGSSEPSGSMDMSLDDMIASRRRSTRSSKSTSAAPDANKVSNVDRSIATSRAKRTAALRARRGLSTNRKATQMEIEAEVQKQGQKTLLEKSKKAQAQKKLANRGRVSAEDRAEIRKERRRLAREAAKAKKEELANKGGKKKAATTTVVGGTVAETAPLGRPPSKKAVKAAVSAMEDKGFTIPNGYQMVISFAPADGATTSETSKGGGGRKNNNNNNAANNKGGKQRGGRK